MRPSLKKRDQGNGMLRFMIGGILAMATATTVHSSPAVPSDEQIRKIISERVDVYGQSLGIVVGIIEPAGQRIVSYGRYGSDDPRRVDVDTIFEIGSITKVFTGLLLADMVRRDQASLADAAAKYLPASAAPAERQGKAITLRDLATHTSGLPRLPDNMAPGDPDNPYADYTVDQLYAFLSRYQLPRDIGSQYEYSNLGYGLLGHILALNASNAGAGYEKLLQSRIAEPLALDSTAITLSQVMKARLAGAHDQALQPVPHWDLKTLAGAGALRSTAKDMLSFLSVPLGYRKTPLAQAFAMMTTVRYPLAAATEASLGWVISEKDGEEIVWHNGGTGGHRAFIGYRPKTRTGVVVLSNASALPGIDDIGLHLLHEDFPLAEPPRRRKAVAIDPDMLETYVGHYQLAPDFILVVTREGERLFAQATGQPMAEIFAESETEFFYKVVDAQIVFESGPQGAPATGLVLHQGGQRLPAQRMGK
jgi:CubicO group peptidase (beta-lactamase class C family)